MQAGYEILTPVIFKEEYILQLNYPYNNEIGFVYRDEIDKAKMINNPIHSQFVAAIFKIKIKQ